MATSIKGTYRDGYVELKEPPAGVPDNTPVIVTFLEPGIVDLRTRGIDQAAALDLSEALSTFSDRNEPDMALYDDYDASRARV